jgi:hypothetical protein
MPLRLRENENRNDADISKLHIKVKNVNKKIRSLKENYKTIHRVIPRSPMVFCKLVHQAIKSYSPIHI